MKKIIEELKQLQATLKADGYKSWCYSQLTIDKTIKFIQERKNLNEATGKRSELIEFLAWLSKRYEMPELVEYSEVLINLYLNSINAAKRIEP